MADKLSCQQNAVLTFIILAGKYVGILIVTKSLNSRKLSGDKPMLFKIGIHYKEYED